MADPTYHSASIYKTHLTSTGQIQNVSTGCTIRDENVATSGSTLSTTFKNNGLSVISTTHVCTLGAPAKGVRKDIIFTGSTLQMALKMGGSATINNSTDDVVTVTLGTTKAAQIGQKMTFFGLSTAKWWLGTAIGTSDVSITLSSAT